MKKMKRKFKSIEGAIRRVEELERINKKHQEVENFLYNERRLMARLASEVPQFSNPFEVDEAKKVRNRILAGQPLASLNEEQK